MSNINKITNALHRADIILEQVDPTGMEELLPEEGDTPEELFEKRWRRFLVKPHISRSYAIGGGVNLNDFLPPGMSMSGESIDQFNAMVTQFPTYWWTRPNDPMYDTYWNLFISGIFIYAIEWSGDDFTSLLEWAQWTVSAFGGAADLYDRIMQEVTMYLVQQLGYTIQQIDGLHHKQVRFGMTCGILKIQILLTMEFLRVE